MSPTQVLLTMLIGCFAPPIAQSASAAPVDGGSSYVVRTNLLGPVVSSGPAAQQPMAGVVTRNIEPGGPWLGIQFGPVSKPLAAHLDVGAGVGQMVLNIAEGSPADTAGFQQYDVIVSLDGKPVSSDIGKFLDTVRNFAPGQSHSYSVIRQGKSVQTNVVIGTRPADDAPVKYKYESAVEELSGDRLFQRGGLLQKDDQGNWTFQGLDHLNNMPDVWQYFNTPGAMGGTSIPGGNNTQLHVFSENGKTIQIQKDADGKFHVTKTEIVNGQKNTSDGTYNDETAFQAADPDAYKQYKSQANGSFKTFNFSIPNGGVQGMTMPDMSWTKDFDDLMKGWQGPLTTQKDMQKWLEQHQGQLNKHFGQGSGRSQAFMTRGARGTSFETNADGSIRVITRRGGDELVENYANAQALKAARPDLHAKYQKLIDGQDTHDDK